MKHTLSVLVENKFGVLARITGLFSGRGFNIDSLNVAPTNDPHYSRITVSVHGDESVLDQLVKQLRRLINVLEVKNFTKGQAVLRELVMVKVSATTENRSEILQICDIFRSKIINVTHNSVVIEMTGDEGKVSAFLDLIEPYGVLELARTGNLALERK